MLRSHDIREQFRDLYRIPPGMTILIGFGLIVLGAAIAAWGWKRGLLFQAHLVLCLAGLAALFLGLSSRKKRAEIEKQIRVIEERGKEIVEKVAELRKSGGAPMKWLIDQGLTDPRIQSYLLQQASPAKPSKK